MTFSKISQNIGLVAAFLLPIVNIGMYQTELVSTAPSESIEMVSAEYDARMSTIKSTTKNDDISITASNFVISVYYVNVLNARDIKNKFYANIKAENLHTGKNLSHKVVVDAVELEDLRNTKQTGTYQITLSLTDNGATLKHILTIYVIDHNTKFDKAKDEAIHAKKFHVHIDDIGSLDKRKIDELSGAKAWKISTGNEVDFTTQIKDLKPQTGTYEVDFISPSGLKNTAFVSVRDDNSVIPETDQEVMSAKSFKINIDEVDALTDDKIIAYSEAKAWKMFTLEPIPVIVNWSDIRKEAGGYRVLFKTPGTFIPHTKIASVIDSATVLDDKSALVAYDFTLKKKEVATLNNERIQELARVKSWRLETGASVPYSTSFSNIKAETGTYSVFFQIEGGLTKTVRAQVLDDDPPIKEPDPENKIEPVKPSVANVTYQIRAKDVAMTVQELEQERQRNSLNEYILSKSEAKAYMVVDGEQKQQVPLQMDTAALYGVAQLTSSDEVMSEKPKAKDIQPTLIYKNIELEMDNDETFRADTKASQQDHFVNVIPESDDMNEESQLVQIFEEFVLVGGSVIVVLSIAVFVYHLYWKHRSNKKPKQV